MNAFLLFQVVSSTMCHAKCAVITVPANTMGFSHVTVVLDFSSVPSDVIATMCANLNPRDVVPLTRHTEINAVPVVCRSASMSA